MHAAASWRERSYPFRHYVADSVLDPDQYARVAAEFSRIERGLDPDSSVRLSKSRNYDALTFGMRASVAAGFRPLFEKHWIDQLADLVGIKAVPALDAGLHHVPQGSRSGWIHSDCCSAWFNGPVPQKQRRIVFPDRRMCDYFSGEPKHPEARPAEYVRAATMIFYLRNEGWEAGMGGETGLYAGSKASYGGEVLVPPVDNTLVLFECSPHSYHRLIANPGKPRNSIVLWLHSTVEESAKRWSSGVMRRGPR